MPKENTSVSLWSAPLYTAADYGLPGEVAPSRLDSRGGNQTFFATADDKRLSASELESWWRVHRKLRHHRERLGIMRGLGHFGGSAVIVTYTEADDARRGSTDYQVLINSRLTAVGARWRRLGFPCRVTAKEYGGKTARSHHHQVLDIGGLGSPEMLYAALLVSSARFSRFARRYVLTDNDCMAIRRRAASEARGDKRLKGRTFEEMLVARWFASEWRLGFVDLQVVPGRGAVGYCLCYVGKAVKRGAGSSVRVSYSRACGRGSEAWQDCSVPLYGPVVYGLGHGPVVLETRRLWAFHDIQSWAWRRGAVALVYAHDGEAVRYPGRTVEASATVLLPDGTTRPAVTASPLALALARAIDERPFWRVARLCVEVAQVRAVVAQVAAIPARVLARRYEAMARRAYDRARNFGRSAAEAERVAARQRATVWPALEND